MSDNALADDNQPISLQSALEERFLSYALSTITARSLPDVRDGLKPVHRRLLYAMRQLKLDPRSGFKKCARVVGDVIGKFHPHGDQAVYDALVRLAQDFAQRYPLVDGQGNFGNIDGDNAAAMRYTEARLTAIAEALLDGIDQDTVDFRETYDGEDAEPLVLPAAFPNLLANGATGIAVGMATSIPPHNAAELCDAAAHLIKFPNAGIAKLLDLMPGPDFPTCGLVVEPPESIQEAYATGRGGFRLRAKWHKEDAGRGTYRIVVTEIPYQVQKGKLVERIAELVQSRKITLITDLWDESDERIRLVIEPKTRTVDAEALMESLFRQTDLEVRIPLNLNVLDADGTPKVMSLREALQAFIDHRLVVLERRSRFRLKQIADRLEILAGYLIVYLNLDEVIRIIREEDDPKAVMMARWDLSEVQADAILNMRLRSLRKLQELEIRKEDKALREEQKGLNELLADEGKMRGRIAAELAEVKKLVGPKTELGARRTQFASAPSAQVVPLEALIEREPVTVICSQKGWIRTLRGHAEADGSERYKDGDRGRFWFHAQTTDKLLLFATNGRFYTLPADKLPRGRGHGEPVKLMVDLGNDQDIVALFVHRPGGKLLVASSDGRGFVIGEDQVLAQTRSGKQVLNVSGDTEAQVCVAADGDTVAVVGDNRKLLIFPLAELPEMTRGRGVTLQRYRDGGLSDVKVFTRADGLSWHLAGGRRRTETDLLSWEGKRANAGRLPPTGFPKSNKFT